MRQILEIRHALKRFIYAFMPPSWQEAVDRRFYLRRFARGPLSSEPEFELLPALARPGETALDVGANLGGYTIGLSRLVGPAGKVHSFEPVPRTFRLLRHNVARLAPCNNVWAEELAVSDHCGRAQISIPLEGTLPNYYVATLASGPSSLVETIEVETVTLDKWSTDAATRVDFIKIDVEGAEWQVLNGARQLIARDRPIVICELGDSIRLFGHTHQEVFDLMVGFGYAAFRFLDGTLHLRREPDALALPNYVFVPSDKAHRLAAYFAATQVSAGEELAPEVLQQADPSCGHGEPAPPSAGAVMYRPDQRDAALFSRQAPDDLGSRATRRRCARGG